MIRKTLMAVAGLSICMAALAAAQPPASISGQWEGTWTNSRGSQGYDWLDVTEDPYGRIRGIWGESRYRLEGERIGPSRYAFRAHGRGRSYEGTARLGGGGRFLTIDYEAIDRDRGEIRRYGGGSRLRRVGY
jgi:hypothetical protein